MQNSQQDPWVSEDETDSAPEVQKPDVFADPAIPTLVLPKPQVAAATDKAKPASEEKAALTEIDAVLPSDIKDLMRGFEILRELQQKLPAKTDAEKAVRHSRIKRVRDHLFNLQQLPHADADPREHLLHAANRIANAPKNRAKELEKLNAAISNGKFDEVPTAPNRKIDAVLERVLAESSVKGAVALARSALANYKRHYYEHFSMAHPETRLREIKYEMSGVKDFDLAKSLNAETVELASPHARVIANNSRALLNVTFDQYCRPALINLINEAIQSVEGYKQQASEKEKAFFQENGITAEATQLSRRFEPALQQLRAALSQTTTPSATGIGILSTHLPDDTVLSQVFALDILQ